MASSDDRQHDTPPEFPSSPAQAALDESAGYLAEALSLVRHVARDFDRLTPDQRYRVAASVGRELQRTFLAGQVTAGLLADLGAGREPATWPDLLAVKGQRLVSPQRLDGLSVTLLTAAGTVEATAAFGPVWSHITAGALAVASWAAARVTPHTAKKG